MIQYRIVLALRCRFLQLYLVKWEKGGVPEACYANLAPLITDQVESFCRSG
jgi:hypothetical protein